MARKKQEVALQLEINSQEEWEELMQKEGLIIVDVFQDWCGPCKAVLSFFRRIKNEIGDDFLHFATAKCDTIDSLDKYRGRCEPCFLIYGGGALVSVIRGANPPALEEIIKSKLEEEHKVMKGEIERKEIKDPYLSGVDVEEKVEKDDKDVEEIEQEVTLALIKPDVVKAGKMDEIISKLKERGIEILAQQERNLTEEEARSFYHHMETSDYFDSLITFLTSGPSYVLVLAKGDEGIIHEFRELIGPKVFEEAKEKAPDSFRAVYGTNSIENAIHGADDKESVHRELAFFFPDFIVPKIARKKQEDSQHQQRTLALIRPAAFAEFKDSILEKIKTSGFKISMQKEVKLTKEEAELFYKDHAGKAFFEELTTEMSKGTLLALALEKQQAISGFRGILGPKDVEKAKENDPGSLRAQFSKEDISINLIHGSDSEENAQIELKYFFPVEQTIAAIKPDGLENRDEIVNRIEEARFAIVKTLDIVLTKEMAEELYCDQREQDYFDDLITHMQSGSTLFMVLSREDAIRGWRSIMGPKDPNIAAESYPDSIRAIYGKDVKENAVYGSADTNEVSRVMNLIFGKLEFYENGTLLEKYVTKEQKDDDHEEHKPSDNSDDRMQEEQQEETHSSKEEMGEHSEIEASGDFLASSERIIMEPEMAIQSTAEDATLYETAPIESSLHVQHSETEDAVPSEEVVPNDSSVSPHLEPVDQSVDGESATTDVPAPQVSAPIEDVESSGSMKPHSPVEHAIESLENIDEEVEGGGNEDAVDSTEISGHGADITGTEATEEDLHQENTVVDDDESHFDSFGGPMEAGKNVQEEAVSFEKEKSELDTDKIADHVIDEVGVGVDKHGIEKHEENINSEHEVGHSESDSKRTHDSNIPEHDDTEDHKVKEEIKHIDSVSEEDHGKEIIDLEVDTHQEETLADTTEALENTGEDSSVNPEPAGDTDIVDNEPQDNTEVADTAAPGEEN